MSSHASTSKSRLGFPYPGLRPFESNESHLFFGREEQVFEMFSLLEIHRFLAVVGGSGSGKSSLVRAGLLPRLRDEGLINQREGVWRFLIMRPGNSPLDALAIACHRRDDVTETTLAQGTLHGGDPVMTRVVLESGPKGMVRVLSDARVPDDDNVLLVVDQFEELFRFADSNQRSDLNSTGGKRNESMQFVALLLETARQTERPVHVVLTMRTDFIGDCDQFDGLPQAINAAQLLVPRLSWRQLEMAITEPLQIPGFNCQIDRAIVDHMMNAALKERDALPLVQHALLRMWLAANHNVDSGSDSESDPPARHITENEHYLPIGGLSQALDLHANELYAVLTTDQQRIAACLFRCLSERSPKGQLTRRLSNVLEVAGVADVRPEAVIDVVEVFRQPGVNFLMTSPAGPAQEAATRIDISHESLLRQWKLLQSWVEEESEASAGYRRLIDAVQQGEQVIDGIRLDRAVEWRDSVRPTQSWANRYDLAEESVHAGLPQCLLLIERSLAEREARRLAEEAVRLEREQSQEIRVITAERNEEIAKLKAENAKRLGEVNSLMLGFVVMAAVLAGLLRIDYRSWLSNWFFVWISYLLIGTTSGMIGATSGGSIRFIVAWTGRTSWSQSLLQSLAAILCSACIASLWYCPYPWSIWIAVVSSIGSYFSSSGDKEYFPLHELAKTDHMDTD